MVRRIFAFLGTKIGIALIVAACIMVGALIAIKTPDEKDAKKDGSVVAIDLIKKSLDADTDGDGLKDWEEALYGTDIANADTDGDGMNDNDEIKANRSPLVPGAGEGAKIEASATSSAYVPNATDRFSRELFSKYLEAKSSGQEIDEELSDAIAEELLAQQYQPFVEPFDVSKLNIIGSEDAASLRTYGNALGKALSTPAPDPNEFEFSILDRIMTGTSLASDGPLLSKIIQRYNFILQTLIDMPVPAGMASMHAEYIQGTEILRDISVGISTLETDPIGAYSKIAQYEEALNVISAAAIKSKTYLTSRGVSFSAQESGYVLMR